MNHIRTQFYSLANRVGRIFKIDAVYFSSGVFWSGVGTVGSLALAFCTTVAFANFLSKEDYGTYQYVLATVSLLAILALPGLKTAISYASARGKDGTFFRAVRAKIRWGFVSASVAFIIAVYYFIQGNQLLGNLFLLSAFFIPWWEVYGSYVPYLQGKKRFKELTIYEFVVQLINAIAIISVLFFTDTLVLLLGAFFLSYTAARYIVFKRTLSKIPPNDEQEPGLMKYGTHLSLMSIFGTIASTVDKILLWQFLGPVAIAVYTFALAIPSRGVGVLATVNRLYFPKATERSMGEIQETLWKRVGILSIISFALAILYAVVAPYIFNIFFPQYTEAIIYTQIAAFLIAFQPFSLFSTALSAHARTKELYFIQCLPPLIQIVLFVLLIPSLHILGALLALLGAQIVEAILSLILLKRAKD